MLTLDKERKSVVIALGYFDSVHIGHKKVIAEAKELANSLSVSLAVFTFDGNLRGTLSDNDDKEIYTTEERKEILKGLGANEIYLAPIDFGFLSLGKIAFLNLLLKEYDVKGFVCGNDYKYGKFGKGNVESLARFAKQKGIALKVVDNVNTADGKRISTTLIKNYIKSGEIEKANELLTRCYSVTGEVIKDRSVGKTIGFPTANLIFENDKQTVKEGVYAGKVSVDGTLYSAVINYGYRATFGVFEKRLEAHLLDFSGDIYGKTVTVYFERFLREDKKFDNPDELKEQIESDVKRVRDGK